MVIAGGRSDEESRVRVLGMVTSASQFFEAFYEFSRFILPSFFCISFLLYCIVFPSIETLIAFASTVRSLTLAGLPMPDLHPY